MKALEAWLGAPLFVRGTREVRLTPEGARLLPPVRQALDLLALAAGQVSRRGRRDVLAIQAYTTFAQRWLIPRLTRFHELHPGIGVRLTASVSPVDFLVRPRHRPVSAAMRRFRDWILAELAAAAETDG